MALVRVSANDPRIAPKIGHPKGLPIYANVTYLEISKDCFWAVHTEDGSLVFQDSMLNHRKLMKSLGICWGNKRATIKQANI